MFSSKMKGHTYVQWSIAIIVNGPLFSYGLLSGWMSPMTKVLKSDKSPTGEPLNDTEISWIASCMCISAMLSTPVYSYLSDRIGRKRTTIAVVIPQIISWTIKLTSSKTSSLIIARIICGIASGGCFTVVPMYTKEISQDSIRGLLGSLLMLFQNLGLLVMYAMGAYVEYYTIIWISLASPVLNIFLLLRVPESPAYLVKHGKINEATEALSVLRGLDKNDKMIQNEISRMRTDEMFYKSLPKISFQSIFTDVAWRKSLILAAIMMTAAASNGNFAIITYAVQIIRSSGVTFNPDLQTLSFPAVLIFGSFVSMCFVEKFGRKVLLALFLLMAMAAIIILATILLLQERGAHVPGLLSVLTIVCSVFANGAGIMPLPYIIMSEMFNFQIRAKLMGIIVTYAWFVSFLQLVSFAPISQAMGMYTMFYMFAIVNLLGAVFTLVFVPETRGKSIEQLESELRGEKICSNIVNK